MRKSLLKLRLFVVYLLILGGSVSIYQACSKMTGSRTTKDGQTDVSLGLDNAWVNSWRNYINGIIGNVPPFGNGVVDPYNGDNRNCADASHACANAINQLLNARGLNNYTVNQIAINFTNTGNNAHYHAMVCVTINGVSFMYDPQTNSYSGPVLGCDNTVNGVRNILINSYGGNDNTPVNYYSNRNANGQWGNHNHSRANLNCPDEDGDGRCDRTNRPTNEGFQNILNALRNARAPRPGR